MILRKIKWISDEILFRCIIGSVLIFLTGSLYAIHGDNLVFHKAITKLGQGYFALGVQAFSWITLSIHALRVIYFKRTSNRTSNLFQMVTGTKEGMRMDSLFYISFVVLIITFPIGIKMAIKLKRRIFGIPWEVGDTWVEEGKTYRVLEVGRKQWTQEGEFIEVYVQNIKDGLDLKRLKVNKKIKHKENHLI